MFFAFKGLIGKAMFQPSTDMHSDSEILAALIRQGPGRTHALTYLYSKYRKMIYAMVLKQGGTEEEAQEVLHEGLIRLEQSVRKGRFEENSKLSTYFYTICRNYWLKSRNRYNLIDQESGEEVGIEDLSENVLDLLQQKDFRVQVQKILNHMTQQCYELLLWTDGENTPMEEVAKRLGFNSVQAARNQKTRCRKRLRDLIYRNPSFRALVSELLDSTDLEKSWK